MEEANATTVMEAAARTPRKFNAKEAEEYLKSFPVGFVFKPEDDELVIYYLKRKIYNRTLPPHKIKEVQLYNHEPETLADLGVKSFNGKNHEWYFFTPRDKKYRNGKRPRRAAGDGFWKATGADKVVKYKGKKVGVKKTLVYYRGKPPRGEKTNWIMHEYVLSDPPAPRRTSNDNDMLLDRWVICRVYKKDADSRLRALQQSTDQEMEEEEAEDSMVADDETETHHTETPLMQEHGIPPLPQSGPQQYPMLSYYNNSFDYYSPFGGFPAFPGHPALPESLPHHQTPNGNFIPNASPLSSFAPPADQFHYMNNPNNIYQFQPQQQQVSGVPQPYDFSVDDGFLLYENF